MEVEDSITEKMEMLQIEAEKFNKLQDELETLKKEKQILEETNSRQDIVLSHWKNHSNDLSERLQRIAASSGVKKNLFDVFEDKSVERIIETLAMENFELHNYFNCNKENSNSNNAAEMAKKINSLEEANTEFKKLLEYRYKELNCIRRELNKSSDGDLKKHLAKQAEKLSNYKQENLKLKSYVFLQDSLMKYLKKNFEGVRKELYHIFRKLCIKYGSNLENELQNIDENEDAMDCFTELLERKPVANPPQQDFEKFKRDPMTDTLDSGIGSLTERDRQDLEKSWKVKNENDELKNEKKTLQDEITSLKQQLQESELNFHQSATKCEELWKKCKEYEEERAEHLKICKLQTSVSSPPSCSQGARFPYQPEPYNPFAHFGSYHRPQEIMCRDGPILPEQHEPFMRQSSRQRDTINFQSPGMFPEGGYQGSSNLPFSIDRPRIPLQRFDFSAQIRAPYGSPTTGSRLSCENCGETFNNETEKLAHLSECRNIHDRYT